MHDNNIAHRDIKPENILIDQLPINDPITSLSDPRTKNEVTNFEVSALKGNQSKDM